MRRGPGLALLLALGGCTAGPDQPPPSQPQAFLRAGADAARTPPLASWWLALNDSELSRLEAAGLAYPPAFAAAQARLRLARADAGAALAADIARIYVELREAQSAQVLLAQQEDIDSQVVEAAKLRLTAGVTPRQPLEAAEAKLDGTRSDQQRGRAAIAALRDRLAVLTRSLPGTLDTMPPGAIPLPPAALTVGDPAGMLARRPDIRMARRKLAIAARGPRAWRGAALADYQAAVLAAMQDAESALARYGAARVAAGHAQAAAAHARAIAELQTLRGRAGTLAPVEALTADRQALEALITEQHARAAMTLAYVALAKALGLGCK